VSVHFYPDKLTSVPRILPSSWPENKPSPMPSNRYRGQSLGGCFWPIEPVV